MYVHGSASQASVPGGTRIINLFHVGVGCPRGVGFHLRVRSTEVPEALPPCPQTEAQRFQHTSDESRSAAAAAQRAVSWRRLLSSVRQL